MPRDQLFPGRFAFPGVERAEELVELERGEVVHTWGAFFANLRAPWCLRKLCSLHYKGSNAAHPPRPSQNHALDLRPGPIEQQQPELPLGRAHVREELRLGARRQEMSGLELQHEPILDEIVEPERSNSDVPEHHVAQMLASRLEAGFHEQNLERRRVHALR